MGFLDRLVQEIVVGEAVISPFEMGIFAGPKFFENLDYFVAQRRAVGKWWSAQGLEFFFQPTGYNSHRHPAMGKDIERRQGLGSIRTPHWRVSTYLLTKSEYGYWDVTFWPSR